MKLDILVLAAHPDDAELGCGGTIAASVEKGLKVGIIDFTKGEMGTRGTPEIRIQEANESASILGLAARENMGFEDGFFKNDKDHQLRLIPYLRFYRPDIVIANSFTDRHPDHGRAAELSRDACFLSGLDKVVTEWKGVKQDAWRPKNVFHFVQSTYLDPDFVVDISDYWDIKVKSILAFKSQFYDPDNSLPDTFISSPEFLDLVKGRAIHYGVPIGKRYGEGFLSSKMLGVKSLKDLI